MSLKTGVGVGVWGRGVGGQYPFENDKLFKMLLMPFCERPSSLPEDLALETDAVIGQGDVPCPFFFPGSIKSTVGEGFKSALFTRQYITV